MPSCGTCAVAASATQQRRERQRRASCRVANAHSSFCSPSYSCRERRPGILRWSPAAAPEFRRDASRRGSELDHRDVEAALAELALDAVQLVGVVVRARAARDSAFPCRAASADCTTASQPASASRAFRFSASVSVANDPACSQKRSAALCDARAVYRPWLRASCRGGAFVASSRVAPRRARPSPCPARPLGCLRLHLRLFDARQDLVEIEARLVGCRGIRSARLRQLLRGSRAAGAVPGTDCPTSSGRTRRPRQVPRPSTMPMKMPSSVPPSPTRRGVERRACLRAGTRGSAVGGWVMASSGRIAKRVEIGITSAPARRRRARRARCAHLTAAATSARRARRSATSSTRKRSAL